MTEFEKTLSSPIGILTLKSSGGAVNALLFGDHCQGLPSCPVLEQAATELEEYFSGTRRVFSIPLHANGTEFQRTVWTALLSIPHGETVSYADLAAKIGKPAACRAVGNANNRNPLPILIPCHRVIGKNGSLTGYAGGLAVKEFLLRLEQKNR